MTDDTPSFAGSIPADYEARLVPMFFEPYARDMATRLPARTSRVIETAAGTGVVARHLLERLDAEATMVVTDLQDAMLAVARKRMGGDPRVTIHAADAVDLPYDDRSFDLVVCQFGLMFFSDKLAGLREARRVLTPDGTLLLSTWGSLDDNPVAGITHEEVTRVFPEAPPPFLRVPFGMHDPDAVVDLLHAAGFSYVTSEVVSLEAMSPSAHHAAVGLLCGSPMFTQLQERGLDDPRGLIDALAARLARAGGFAPMRLPMKAFVFTAR